MSSRQNGESESYSSNSVAGTTRRSNFPLRALGVERLDLVAQLRGTLVRFLLEMALSISRRIFSSLLIGLLGASVRRATRRETPTPALFLGGIGLLVFVIEIHD